ncbi:hypothetical protein PAFU01_12940 [Pantoea ananatis]|nr:hypothetical protein PAFU01_12940 [Pantoea ananatis]
MLIKSVAGGDTKRGDVINSGNANAAGTHATDNVAGSMSIATGTLNAANTIAILNAIAKARLLARTGWQAT